MVRRWWLDEIGHAGPEHLDPAYVAGYEAKAQFDPTDDLAVLRRLGLGPGRTVIDLGAGTGIFALAAAATGARVVAADVSPAMVAALRERVAGSRHAERIEVVEAGFLSLPADLGPVDVVYTRHALHQLPDFWKVVALRAIARLLRPGGVLLLRDLVYDVGPDGIDDAVEGWVDGGAADPARGYTGDELAAHVRDEHSTFTWLLEPMLERTGFEIVERRVHRSVYVAYTCRRRT